MENRSESNLIFSWGNNFDLLVGTCSRVMHVNCRLYILVTV